MAAFVKEFGHRIALRHFWTKEVFASLSHDLHNTRVGKLTTAEWKTLFSEWDGLLRGGAGERVRRRLKKLRLADVPRPMLAEFCGLCRRCHLWEESLTVLKPVIYPKVAGRNTSTPAERIEYAMALRRAGAFHEAQLLLADTKLTAEPRALLALAQNHMVQWNYSEALRVLDRYAELKSGVADYESLVARVNRLACLGFEDDPGFDAVAAGVEADLRAGAHSLLLANVYEISAQKLISNGQFDLALKNLAAALKLVGDNDGPYALLIKKWQVIGEAIRRESVEDLLKHRAQALAVRDWETLRHLDYYVTRLQPDSIWANRAYYGTPYRSFRAKLEQIRGFAEEDWVLAGEGADREFDPWFPGCDEGEFVHRLLVFLLSDLYRPVAIAAVFENLYPGERFDLTSSAVRVRQHLTRLRSWLTAKKIPFRIFHVKGQYGLRLLSGTRVRVRQRALSFDKSGFFFGRLAGQVTAALNSEEWGRLLNMSGRQTLYLLKQGIEDGWITKENRGRYVEYRLKSTDGGSA